MRALRERARTAVASDELRLQNLGDTGVLETLEVAFRRRATLMMTEAVQERFAREYKRAVEGHLVHLKVVRETENEEETPEPQA